VLLWALILGTGALSAGESRIELRDGSVISGEVVGVGAGGYRIRSAALGEVQVRESDVLAIRPAQAGGTTAPGAGAEAGGQTGNLAAIQQQLMGNPQTMDSITRLKNDPGIAAALADPGFAQLILSGDLEALSKDPRFQHLMENPEIQAIVGQVLGR
jgi:hypothetical protein